MLQCLDGQDGNPKLPSPDTFDGQKVPAVFVIFMVSWREGATAMAVRDGKDGFWRRDWIVGSGFDGGRFRRRDGTLKGEIFSTGRTGKVQRERFSYQICRRDGRVRANRTGRDHGTGPRLHFDDFAVPSRRYRQNRPVKNDGKTWIIWRMWPVHPWL